MFISGNVPSLDESPNYTVNVPKQARVMTNFLDSIIDAAQKEKPGSLLHTTIKCFKKSCKGAITIEIESDSSDILWKCTKCHNSGNITCTPGSREVLS